MRVTNIDTLSAYLDRLITERIKHYFFQKDGLIDKVGHQELVIAEIRQKVENLFAECLSNGSYEYLSEKRTFDIQKLVSEVENLTVNDINIGEGDRTRLTEITSPEPNFSVILEAESFTRISNENRAGNKNNIDSHFKELF